MLFNFELVPLDRIPPWENPETGGKRLHWFALTDGQYWIQAGSSTLFEYCEWLRREHGYTRYCDYQVARLYEDVMDMAPHVLEPVPTDLVPFITGATGHEWGDAIEKWDAAQPESRMDEDQYWDTCGAAREWRRLRLIDSLYLSCGLWSWLWSAEETVHLEWDNTHATRDDRPVSTATRGHFAIPREAFIRELTSFHERLMAQMADRVQCIARGALPADVDVDLPALQREQTKREKTLKAALRPLKSPTDWNEVRAAITEISGKIWP